jgi:alginate O-acetyltransferase complex protein AlgJ
MNNHPPRPPAPSLSREDVAKLEIGVTDIAPWLARTMTIAFLVVILAVPLGQALYERSNAAIEIDASGWPRSSAIVTALPDVAGVFGQAKGNLWQRTLAANHHLLKTIDDYESRLQDESLLSHGLLPPTQQALAQLAGLGNEKAYLGRDGWLFYRPSIDYLTGPGFLDPLALAKRAKTGKSYATPPQPDARRAIIDFARQLRHRGIALVVVPAPGKAAIHPEKLSQRYDDSAALLENASFDEWKEAMEEGGVSVFDPAPLLFERKQRESTSQFLKTDTHWTPAAVQDVAKQLQRFIVDRALLPSAPRHEYQTRKQAVENLGDIALMLRLPERQLLFEPESANIRQVLDRHGRLWQPDPSSDVLLLGDSFTNIYSLEAMQWGAGAGLAEQLSLALGRPIDRIAQNDAGAYATRQTLTQELARGNDRLAGKRLVIWEFAARELAVGDWKMIMLKDALPNMPRSEPSSPVSPTLPASGEIVIRARVEAAAGVPPPGSVPYRDAVTALHLSSLEAVAGSLPGEQIVVYLWGMQDNRWTAPARWKPGDAVTLNLKPWDEVRAKYGSFTRIELDDPDFTMVDLPLYWGEATR